MLKLRQHLAVMTQEDWDAWHWKVSWNDEGRLDLMDRYEMSDRRDADLMLRIMRLGCRFCGSESAHGEAHERDCIYVTDPSRRRVWHRQGARIIE